MNEEEEDEEKYEEKDEEEDEEETVSGFEELFEKPTKMEDIMDEDLPPELLKAKLYQQRQERIQNVKEQLAHLAAKILEDPEQRIKSIETFREMCSQEKDVTIKKYIILSELAVYKDIIPGYKIRLPSEKDLQVKVSKEVKKLRAYEAFLLQSYQKYLHYLSHIIKRSPKNHFSEDAPPNTLLTVACKCLGTLLLSAPYFNFTANIINTLVPLANAHCQQLAEMAQKTIKELFLSYKSSETVFEVVKKIYTFLKSRSFSSQPELLALYLHLPLTEQLPEGTQIAVGVSPKGRLSKRQKKKDKVEEKLQKDLKEAMAEEDKSYRRSIQTETLKTVFLVYFKILKLPTTSPVLLPAALEGLAKFSHLINVDVLVDLLEMLRNMITSTTLNPISKLHCAITAFQTLKLQGQSLSLDLKTFFNAFFEILFDILPRVATTDNLIPAVLRCFQLMFKETKQLSLERVAAFIQRILMLSLYLTANSAIAFLSIANSLFNQYPKTQLLLDNQYRGSGIFLPDVDDPEHQNALASTAWEFALLQNHAHPVLKHFAKLVVTMSDMEGTPPPLDLYNFYKPVDTNKKTPRSISYCYPPIPEPKVHQLQKNIAKEGKKQENTKKAKNEIVKAWFVRPAYSDTPFLSSLTERYQKIGHLEDAVIQNQFKDFFEDLNSVVVIN
uniref:Nucleolar complex protein 3 homolog n=1 Tax=Arcella intermedia TaxID=1963864 RepID=A0A6B2KZ52_9EUKA